MFTVRFFDHRISKLIIGDNPMSGHSYIEYQTTGEEMKRFYTAEKILETLFRIEDTGINTLLPLADPFMIRVLSEYEYNGGKLQYIFQPYRPMDIDVSIRQMTSLHNIIALYHQGALTDMLYETNQCDAIHQRLMKFRGIGIPVGLGSHYPEVITKSETEGWDVDFYLGCMQNVRKGREGEESGFFTGKTKSAIRCVPEDRPLMLNCLKKIKKPVIAFKIFAGGQIFYGKTEEEKRQAVKDAYEEVFSALKPEDCAAIGIFQRDKDELAEDVSVFNEWQKEKERGECSSGSVI